MSARKVVIKLTVRQANLLLSLIDTREFSGSALKMLRRLKLTLIEALEDAGQED